MNYSHLFSPLRVGNLIFRNRIVFPPIATNFASVNGEVTPEMIYHYGRRAQGGAAMVTMENMCIQFPNARHGTTQPRVDDDSFIAGLSRVAYEIHKHGSLAFMELTHPGLFSNLKISDNITPVAPSVVKLRPDGVLPHELTYEEIEAIADIFAQAALRAKKAHFDGVETEAAHGLLIDQFLSPLTNKRTDEFGGSVENRVRFSKMIIDKIKQLCGANFTVTARIGVVDFVEGGITIEEGVEIAKAYEEMGYAAVHADVGFGSKEKRLEPMQYPEAWRGYMAEALKKAGIKIPVVAVGMIRNPQRAEEILENGGADLIGLGRALIADPDWPVKAQMGYTKEIKRCIGCSECIKARHDEGTALRCGVNPNVGSLETDEILHPAIQKKTILVIGAGPAGLEAAVTLRKRGHEVIVWEKQAHIGGALSLGAVPPGKEKINWLIEYYDYMMEKLHIPIEFNKTATLETVNDLEPDTVVISMGANYTPPPIKGIDKALVKSFQEILDRSEVIQGKKVVVGGGGLVGCETALDLRDKGNEVTIVEMLPEIAIGMEPISRGYLLREIEEKGIICKTSSPVQEILDDGVRIGNNENSEILPADLFVTAFGGRQDHSLYLELKKYYETYQIGDVYRVGKIIDAVHAGFAIGKKL
jgi:2,4-dienoyl-CoA reductase-like NADH-dependent reductase (Old Yellow Enzyme family)/thioredoxin reductase